MASPWNLDIQRTNRLFEALSKEWRRLILQLVRDGEVHNVADLTDDADHETPGTDIQLVHVHLPKLAGAGYVTWNRETGALAKGPQFADVEPFLHVLSDGGLVADDELVADGGCRDDAQRR